jgi:hypothetical protein
MTVFSHALRRVLRQLLVPWLAVSLLGAALLGWLVTTPGFRETGYGARWLYLPGLLLVAATLGAALDTWPPLSRGRPGADWLLRLRPGAGHGGGAAVLGTLAALAIALASCGAIASALLAGWDLAPPAVRARVALHTAQPYLSEHSPLVELHLARRTPLATIELQLDGIYAGGDLGPARLRVQYDEGPAAEETIESSGGLLRLEPPAGPVQCLRLHRVGGGMPLRVVLPASAGYLPGTHSLLANGALALLSFLAPALLACCVMLAAGSQLGLPVNLAAGLTVLVLSTLLGITPVGAAVEGFAQGHWLPAEPLVSTSLATVSIGAAIVLLGRLAGRRGST